VIAYLIKCLNTLRDGRMASNNLTVEVKLTDEASLDLIKRIVDAETQFNSEGFK